MLLKHRDPRRESEHATVGESLEPNAVAMLSCGKSQPGRARSLIGNGYACVITLRVLSTLLVSFSMLLSLYLKACLSPYLSIIR